MTKTYIDWIDEKQELLEREIAKLHIAREVLKLAHDDVERSRGRGEKQKQLQKMPPLAEPGTYRSDTGGRRNSIRPMIIAAMRSIGKPVLVTTLVNEVVSMNPKITRKQVGNALYNTITKGQLIRDPVTKLYRLPSQTENVAA